MAASSEPIPVSVRGQNPPRKRKRAVTQTIEQIEARAVKVREEENEALLVLVHAMREIAVRLPIESKLPMVLAKRAKAIESWVQLVGDHHSQATSASNELYDLIRDLEESEPE